MQAEAVNPLIRAAGGFAIVSGIISAVGVVFLIALYALLFGTPLKEVRIATIVGIAAMLVVIMLQLALIFGVLTFQQQVVWVS